MTQPTRFSFRPVASIWLAVSGGLSIALGLAVMVGWQTRTVALVQVQPLYAPMQYNTAIAVTLAGVAVLALNRGLTTLARVAAALAAGLGLLALGQDAFSIDLHIDQLFFKPYIVTDNGAPGRMAPNTALCFAIAGTALLAATTRLGRHPAVLGVAGTVVMAIAGAAAAGHFLGVEEAYRWGMLSRMAIQTAWGLMLFGSGLVTLAMRRQGGATDSSFRSWTPILAAIAMAASALVFGQASRAQEEARIDQALRLSLDSFTQRVRSELESRVVALARLTRRQEVRGLDPDRAWEADAALYIGGQLGYRSITWFDPLLRARSRIPAGAAGVETMLADPIRRALLQAQEQTSARVVSIQTDQGDALLVAVPMVLSGDSTGLMVGYIPLGEIVDRSLDEAVSRGYSISLLHGDRVIGGRDALAAGEPASPVREAVENLWGFTSRVRMWPRPGSPAARRSALPEGILLGGLVIAVLLGSAIHLGGIARRRAVDLARVNQELDLDIRRRKTLEHALQIEKTYFQELFEGAPEAIVLLDSRYRAMRVNREFTRLFGYEADEVIGQPLTALIAPEHQLAEVRKLTVEAATGLALRFEAARRRKDGTLVDVAISGIPIAIEGEPTAFCVICRDISERKRAEEALRASEERFRLLAEHARDVIYRFRIAPTVGCDYISPFVGEMTGYRPEEFASDPTLCYQLVPPSARAQLVAVHQGSPEPVVVPLTRKDGRTVWAEPRTVPIYDEGGTLVAVEGVLRDVTARIHLEEQLRQSQKMEAIGRLAGGIAHDFNNLLTVILGYSDELLEELPADRPHREHVLEVRAAADRASQLTRQLLAFARRQILQPRLLNLNAVVANLETMLRRLIGEDITLETVLAPDLWTVRTDPAQIEQALLNLAVNARDAMPRGGRLIIETANTDLDESYATQRADVNAGPHVLITVSDTGVGMDAEIVSRIFEPFFTTKGTGHGTGLGLSTVYGIVKQGGGHIAVYSEPGHGTVFKIYLPRAQGTAQVAPGRSTPGRRTRGTETILVVEDEESLRRLAARVLGQEGYTVLEAGHPDEALRLMEGHDGPIDLIVTDVVMPGMSGREMTSRLTSARGRVKIIYMSGYTENAIVHLGVLEPGVFFLQKPFRARDLLEKVREVLEAPDEPVH